MDMTKREHENQESVLLLCYSYLAIYLSTVSLFTCLSCRVVSCLVVSCRVVSCRVVSCRVVSCRVVSCRVVSCRVVSCLVFYFVCLFIFCSRRREYEEFMQELEEDTDLRSTINIYRGSYLSPLLSPTVRLSHLLFLIDFPLTIPSGIFNRLPSNYPIWYF